MATTADPILVGIIFDFPQADGGEGFERAARLGLEHAAGDRIDRPVEFVRRQATGMPSGSERRLQEGWHELEQRGVLAMLGPSIMDNGLICRPLADAHGLACMNLTGAAATRGEFMFHYQVGSIEEEPIVMARRLAARGLESVAVVHDRSPVGHSYMRNYQRACEREGVAVTGSATISALATDISPVLERIRRTGPAALSYFGVGTATITLARGLAAIGWDVPVLANSSLMMGHKEPSWTEGWVGWEYVDGIADDNRMRSRLAATLPQAAGTPLGCAAYDMGRLLGEAFAGADHLTRHGIKEALEAVKRLPATSGVEGTTMGFGAWDHAALKGEYLVLRRWQDGRSVQVGV